LITRIDADSDVAQGIGFGIADLLGEMREHRYGQVVNTIKTHIFQCLQGDTLARSRQPADDEKVHYATVAVTDNYPPTGFALSPSDLR